jgi:hypothetical protein
VNWFGFAHETIGADRNVTVVYETPGEYYARQAREDRSYLMPWEKLALKHISKPLIAKVYISYINPISGSTIERNQDIPVTVEYDEIARVYNTGILTPLIVLGLLIWWIIIWRRRGYHYNSHETLI